MGQLRYHTGQDRDTEFKQTVCHPVVNHCHQGWIAQNHLLMAYRSGVTVKDSLDIGSEQTAQLRYALYELLGGLLSATWHDFIENLAYIGNLM